MTAMSARATVPEWKYASILHRDGQDGRAMPQEYNTEDKNQRVCVSCPLNN